MRLYLNDYRFTGSTTGLHDFAARSISAAAVQEQQCNHLSACDTR